MKNAWSLVQSKICRKCIDGDGRGNCRLPKSEHCALQEFLPQIIQTVSSVRSNSYDAYVKALRAGICSSCPEQDNLGVCRRRNALECALDRYYPLVIRLIDEVHDGTFSNA